MAQHHGCFFHYCQALYKNIQSLGLSTSYLDDEDIRLACRSVMALGLMPKKHVGEAFELLKENSPGEMEISFLMFNSNGSNVFHPNIGLCQIWTGAQTTSPRVMFTIVFES